MESKAISASNLKLKLKLNEAELGNSGCYVIASCLPNMGVLIGLT